MFQRIAEARSGLVRVSSYVGVANFLILLGIALKWLHGALWPGSSFLAWMLMGYGFAAVSLFLAAWLDRRVIWPREHGIVARVNPQTVIVAVQAAYFISILRAEMIPPSNVKLDLEVLVEDAIRKMGHYSEYRAALIVFEGKTWN